MMRTQAPPRGRTIPLRNPRTMLLKRPCPPPSTSNRCSRPSPPIRRRRPCRRQVRQRSRRFVRAAAAGTRSASGGSERCDPRIRAADVLARTAAACVFLAGNADRGIAGPACAACRHAGAGGAGDPTPSAKGSARRGSCSQRGRADRVVQLRRAGTIAPITRSRSCAPHRARYTVPSHFVNKKKSPVVIRVTRHGSCFSGVDADQQQRRSRKALHSPGLPDHVALVRQHELWRPRCTDSPVQQWRR
jgi:hypothetical protein